MTFYNMMHGLNPMTFFICPMLGLNPNEIPRFRDLFTEDEDHPKYKGKIHIYTRVGGNNRKSGYGEEMLTSHPEFVATYDDNFDKTYGMYVFNVPQKYKEDFDKIVSGDIKQISEDLQSAIKAMFPNIADKIDAILA